MDVFERETLRRTRYNIEEQQDWRCEIDRLPWIQFPSSWKVKVIPPYGDAVVRFHVKLPNGAEKSVYCDSRNSLGFYTNPPTPYWEVYPYNDDVGRCAVDDVAGLLEMIREGAADDRDSTPDHTEDKLDMVKKPGMRLTHHEKAIYDTRVYNDRLYEFAMRILIELRDRHNFDPSLFDKELIGNAFRAATWFLEVGIDHEQSIDIALEWADAWEKEGSESEEEV